LTLHSGPTINIRQNCDEQKLQAEALSASTVHKFSISAVSSAIMPTYVYHCEKCGSQFEQVQSISAKPLTVCSKELCPQKSWGKGKVKRVISGGAGLLFKGSGFYITDYRSDKYKEAAKKDSATPAAKPSSDAKPASSKPDSSAKSSPAAKT
jgi:putative FmdB family regulatory protein